MRKGIPGDKKLLKQKESKRSSMKQAEGTNTQPPQQKERVKRDSDEVKQERGTSAEDSSSYSSRFVTTKLSS